jgi:hypothetical protein
MSAKEQDGVSPPNPMSPGDGELVARSAGTETNFAAANARLLDYAALETQLRTELDAARMELVRTQADLAHQQRRTKERERTEAARYAELKRQLADERARRATAEEERRAVIASLGQRARRRLRRGVVPTEDDRS